MKLLALPAYFFKTPRSKSAFKRIILLMLIINLLDSFGLGIISGAAEPTPNGVYEIFVTKAITDNKILPATYPLPDTRGQEITITACQGEYEPASLVIHALQPIMGLQLAPTDLQGDQSAIPASALDIKVVKCWYQAGSGDPADTTKFGTFLTPELLLNDDKLVRVDLVAKKNYLRTPGLTGGYVCISDTTTDLSGIRPQDAATLQPVDIAANANQQFWVTVLVPDGTPAGTYTGAIQFSGGMTGNIPVNLTVLPFTLEKPNLIYSIFYWGELDLNGVGSIDGSLRTITQYTNIMKDLHAHGVDYPQFDPSRNDTKAIQEMNIRKAVGLPMTGPVFNQDMVNPTPTAVQNRINLLRPYGFTEFFFYGLNEATGSQLTGQRSAWTAIRNAGGKIYASTDEIDYLSNGWTRTQYNTFRTMGDLLDVAVESRAPVAAIAQKYHSLGHKVYNYGNPQTGAELPETYRRNYGLAIWKANYDGVMDCAYDCWSGRSMWNDFDGISEGFRDEVMVLNTVDGVVDTIEWEGFREGVDDTRYLATLQKAIKDYPGATATAAQNWLNNLDPGMATPPGTNPTGAAYDLDAIRAQMVVYIVQLKGATSLPAPAPVASFSASATSGQAPLTLNFTDSSTNSPTSWSWNFGDGTSSTSQNPSHTFNSAGTFPVTLTVANAAGSSSKSLSVTATNSTNAGYTISPTGMTFNSKGGSSSIAVIPSHAPAAWTATSNDSWITITSLSESSGSGRVYYQVSPNATRNKRTGTMAVAGKTFTVTQSRW